VFGKSLKRLRESKFPMSKNVYEYIFGGVRNDAATARENDIARKRRRCLARGRGTAGNRAAPDRRRRAAARRMRRSDRTLPYE
jgi:hypothetical protein